MKTRYKTPMIPQGVVTGICFPIIESYREHEPEDYNGYRIYMLVSYCSEGDGSVHKDEFRKVALEYIDDLRIQGEPTKYMQELLDAIMRYGE